jgi:putative thiamine transport system ATP-binding protein
MAGLRIGGLRIAIGGRVLFERFDLEVARGTITTIMGPSGSGKSTLLSWICGTLGPEFEAEGALWLDDLDLARLPPEERRIGILFQDDLLFPHLSVGENLAFALPPAVRGRRARRDRIEAALEEADLGGFAERDPATLSGGQRARVALMRTLLSAPRALLLDEPFAKLDLELRDRVRRFVYDHARAAALPTLLVTHDPEDGRAAAGQVLSLLVDKSGEALLPNGNKGRRIA